MIHVAVNLAAVLTAAVVSMLIGMLWYGKLFARQWMSLAGMKAADMAKMKKQGVGKSYAAAFIGALLTAYVLAWFVDIIVAVPAPLWGAIIGFMVWLGFIATVTAGSVLWEGKPQKLYLLNNAYHLINMAIMGAIVAAF